MKKIKLKDRIYSSDIYELIIKCYDLKSKENYKHLKDDLKYFFKHDDDFWESSKDFKIFYLGLLYGKALDFYDGFPYIKITWNKGGSIGNYMDNERREVFAEDEPPFPYLTNILTYVWPEISHLKFLKLEKEILEKGEEDDADYYSNCMHGYKQINLIKLFNYIKANK